MREICTLQFGHYSNFIGTHWWNIQENSFSFTPGETIEIDNKVLYREGETLQGQPTYTPRLLLADLKGSLNTLSKAGDLYETPANVNDISVAWNDDLVEVKEENRIEKNKYLQELDNPGCASGNNYKLEEVVNVWSDFLCPRFHPRTVNEIQQFQHNGDSHSFDVFPAGKGLWKTRQFDEDFSDSIRYFVEECDNLQGFQILLDSTDGFAGLASGCMEHLRDEYDSKSILAVPTIASYFSDYDHRSDEDYAKFQTYEALRAINVALCFSNLVELSSMFVPLSTKLEGWKEPFSQRVYRNINYDAKQAYHSSAILATALDTFTLKYRLKQAPYRLNDFCSVFNRNGRKLVTATVSLPFAIRENEYLLNCLDNWKGRLSESITPNFELDSDRMTQLITLRGIDERRLKQPLGPNSPPAVPASRCSTVNEMLTYYYECTTTRCCNEIITAQKPIILRRPMPSILENVNASGELSKSSGVVQADSAPILAGLHSGDQLSSVVESLLTRVRKFKIRRYNQFFEGGLEMDEYKECLDSLMDFKDCYVDDYVV